MVWLKHKVSQWENETMWKDSDKLKCEYFDYVLNWYDHTHTQALFLSLSYTNTRSQTYPPTPPPPSTRRLRTLHAFPPPGLTVRVGGPASSVSSCGRRGRSRRARRPAGRSTTGLRRHFQDGFGGLHPRVSFWKVFVQFFFAWSVLMRITFLWP